MLKAWKPRTPESLINLTGKECLLWLKQGIFIVSEKKINKQLNRYHEGHLDPDIFWGCQVCYGGESLGFF